VIAAICREVAAAGTSLEVFWISTADNPADLFTRVPYLADGTCALDPPHRLFRFPEALPSSALVATLRARC